MRDEVEPGRPAVREVLYRNRDERQTSMRKRVTGSGVLLQLNETKQRHRAEETIQTNQAVENSEQIFSRSVPVLTALA